MSDTLTVMEQRDAAITMLAEWVVAIDGGSRTGWDDWDEHYKDAAYRECSIRKLLDNEIKRLSK